MNNRARISFAAFIASLLATFFSPATSIAAEKQAKPKIPVILDTDIGADIDDAFAIALALSSPEIDLLGITTVAGDAYGRALVVCRMLREIGREDIPVAAGSSGRETPDWGGQLQYGLRPCFRKTPVKPGAVEFIYQRLKAQPGKITLLAIGPLTNVANLLARHPDCKPWIKRIVLMGGSVRVGYENKPPIVPEWNVKSDIKAAQAVFASGVPLVVAPLDATTSLKVEKGLQKRFWNANSPLTNQLHALYQLWDQPTPTLFDPVAVALCFEEKFFKIEPLHLKVDDKGFTRIGNGKTNARVATSIKGSEFLEWQAKRILPKSQVAFPKFEPLNVSAAVARGGMPHRVHVIEDYETDIERRWWLCGKLETRNVPPGSRRACRGVLTNDFDDLQGKARAMYTAVIFNPVPGPPMGRNTRLSFRYWLKGTDKLRVQIYSLTNGYHRCLTLTKLPQEKWQSATVDMTAARRPDGKGGPLSENERIDDIQFYTDPKAELIVDDIVLHDAAVQNEKRPFPGKLLFAGWFDTGRQGKEWPGTFEIVAKEKPLTWKAARSVRKANTRASWIRLHLRGPRPLGDSTHLSFRYHLLGAEGMKVVLVNRTLKDTHEIEVKELTKGRWGEAFLDFTRDSKRGSGKVGKPSKDDRVDEVHFLLPQDAVLLLDEVLLYSPAKPEKK